MNIQIRGASEHNLLEIDLDFSDGLTVVTGVSGSGKTSLVFDTLYHEARRRFLEIYSPGSSGLRLSPARVRSVTGLGTAIAVGQNLLNRNPGSTLATASGMHPFLRLLYANFGERHCSRCGTGLSMLTEDEIVEHLISLAEGSPLRVFAPLLQKVRGSHQTLLTSLAIEFGPETLFVDGGLWLQQALNPKETHDIEIELAVLGGKVSAKQARQVVRQAGALGTHALTLRGNGEIRTLSSAPVCSCCGNWFRDLEPLHFHTPCHHCKGEGCQHCQGTGLYPDAGAVSLSGLRLPELQACSVDEAYAFFKKTVLPPSAERLRTEIMRRLEALERVGLGYITLNRSSPTLSRGESQRVRIAVALTSRLEDMLYVLDEPTIGQHPADVARLLPALRELPGPVIYIEHDRLAAAEADHAIDLGPGAGSQGGQVIFQGTPAQLWEANTLTGRYFSLRDQVVAPKPRNLPEDFLIVRGAHLRNLQDIDVPIPIGRLTVITGVSGSGKSTFVEDVLVASLVVKQPTGCREIEGPPLKPVLVDQSPIGRNPRSNPATYTKLSDFIRDIFASLTSLGASHFSFNRPEGACPTCKGMGATEVKMRYLPSTWIPCRDCEGQRFSDQVLSTKVTFGDRKLSIADFYELSIAEVIPLLVEDQRFPEKSRLTCKRILEALRDIGLGYLTLGQPSPTLSGGEAQRVKLAKFLGRRSLSQDLFVLDEPTTGLHPVDVSRLLVVLDRLVRAGGTIVVVEHNTDVIRAADWVIDLGPGAGPKGGQMLYVGPPDKLSRVETSSTAQALREETDLHPRSESKLTSQPHSNSISVQEAYAHNLKGVDVDFPKGALSVVTGLSGSGKSSLVIEVLEAEARRRFLETLSVYERQSTREGPEALVGAITGLGVTLAILPERRGYQLRATVGAATEISHHLAVLLAAIGDRRCLECDARMTRNQEWVCPVCGVIAPLAEARHFSPSNYRAACLTCHGVGSLQIPRPEKLILHPEKPLCAGAMYSPGFFPKGYLCEPFNHGYYMVQDLAARYNFDPDTTPWNQMTPGAQHAFLYGDPEPLEVTVHSRTGRTEVRVINFPGFYGFIRDWDVGGTYTRTEVCPQCHGERLRPEYTTVTLGGHNIHQLSEMPLSGLAQVLEEFSRVFHTSYPEGNSHYAQTSLHTAKKRLRFLLQVGLGYLQLNRVAGSLSAGEAQRAKLAGMLGSGLTSLTVLLDEPTRGLHATEVEALLEALTGLRDEGNTVIVIEHDLMVIRAADHLIDLGPGAGIEGGEIVAQGKPDQVAKTDTLTGIWLRGERKFNLNRARRESSGWMEIQGARAHNLRGETIRLPLGILVGVCGVSGSGKSTLVIDTLGRALAPKKQTTSVAYEPVEPGEHDAIEGAPARTTLVDQVLRGVQSPVAYLGLDPKLRKIYAASEDAKALGITENDLTHKCAPCKGRGFTRIDMGFLPDVRLPCDTCRGTGLLPEAREVRLRGLALPELYALTIDEALDLFSDENKLAQTLRVTQEVGLGYLVLRQPGISLSGGEVQRLKIARQLSRKTGPETLYILDEPTIGQHIEDVIRLVGVLHRLVEAGGTVLVVEHHPHVLAACDWLVELGPGGGPDGGSVIAQGTPDQLAAADTPTAPYLKDIFI